MEFDQHRNFRDDPTSDCRSFGSNYHPCSQSRKISIGVMAEAPVKMRSRARKEDEAALPNTEKVASSGRKFIEEKNKGSGVIDSLKGKQAEASGQQTSPWISTRSLQQETQTAKTVQFYTNRTSILQSGDGMQKKVDGVEKTPLTETVQFYANQTSILQSSNGVQKKFDSLTYGRTREKGGSTQRMEELAVAAEKEVRVSDQGEGKEKTEKMPNRSNEALRMKLWDILGTAPSLNEQNSQTLEVGVRNLKLAGHLDQKGSRAIKPRQNSDTIETDSESPNQTTRRPVTRSLTRKKALTTAEPKLQYKTNGGNLPTPAGYRGRHQEKNVFAFYEAEHGTVNGVSSVFTSKRSERKISRIEPRKICFSGKDDLKKSRQATDRTKTSPPAKEVELHSNRMESSHSHPPQNDREYLQPKNPVVEEELHHSLVRKKTDQHEDFNSPELPKNTDPQEDFGNASLKKNPDPQYDINCLPFAMKIPIKNYSPSPKSSKSNPTEQGIQSPAQAGRKFTVEGFCDLKTSQTSTPGSFGSDAQTESLDETRELKESPIRESPPVMEEEDRLSQSSSEGQDAEILEEDLPIDKGCRSTETWTREAGSPEKPSFMLRPSKRLRSPEGIKIEEHSPISPSPKGTEESNGLQGPLDQSHEDGLGRAVALFVLALERFKTKMKSQTSKKSSEMLASVAEGIQLQLQNVESHIQTDVGKFTSLGKSKRKRLETRLQAQQERLKLIHHKFNEEVNQHLQDCRSTLEELDAYQIELKGNADRQKASHRKLLLQVEEAIETQLGDAERKITAIHKVARERMFQLKHVITECLK